MHVANCADDGRITLYGHAQATEPQTSGETTVTAAPSVVTDAPDLMVGDWCVVQYDGKQFPGQVMSIVGRDYEVSIMYRCGKYFKWPFPAEDKIFYEPTAIVKKLQGPPRTELYRYIWSAHFVRICRFSVNLLGHVVEEVGLQT